MTSVARGTAFEDKVFVAVQRELQSDRLGISPALSRPFKKKGYYSRDRDAEIIVDVSVEVWLPDADRWSILWVCECKDYASSVPVDDIEEFKAKLDQIAGANKKGVVAVSGALQASALKFARANGIGVVRLLPNAQVQNVLYQLPIGATKHVESLNPEEFQRAFVEPDFVGLNRDFYAEQENRALGSWSALLKSSIGAEPPAP